jgi:hypothetical protein
MLHRGSKILVIFCLIISFASCSRYKKYDTKEIAEIRNMTQKISQNYIGQDEYWIVYNLANDSIVNWQKKQLGLWKYFGYLNGIDYQLDSVFCVNKAKNKIIFSILRRNLSKGNEIDSIWYFYGVKIKEEWCFFAGATLVLPREYYQKDIHTPLSFEKLKQIATSNIYRAYLKKNKKGEWEINDRFFSDLTSGAWCTDCVTQEQWDSTYIRQINKNWSKWDKK